MMRRSRLVTYAILAAAFYCFWTATGATRYTMFNEEQWRLLGWAFALIGAVMAWRVRIWER